jgi:RNA recognition motif-containing protein
MNIFVAKLSYNTSESKVLSAFEAYGEVSSAKIILDRETGRSKGFAFVEMPNDDEARQAIAELNDTEMDGRTIVVKESEPRESRGGGGNNRRSGGGGFSRNRY